MEFSSLIAEFGVRYGIEGLTLDEHGFSGMVVDGRKMVLQQLADAGNCVIAMIELCDAPKDCPAVNQLILKANLSLFMLDDMMLAIHPTSGCYQLTARIDVEQLDFLGFDARLGHILERADQWCSFLDKYIPMAAQAGSADGVMPDIPAMFEKDDFLRV